MSFDENFSSEQQTLESSLSDPTRILGINEEDLLTSSNTQDSGSSSNVGIVLGQDNNSTLNYLEDNSIFPTLINSSSNTNYTDNLDRSNSIIGVNTSEPLAGDTDRDFDVDRNDVKVILQGLKTNPVGEDDPRDINGDGKITIVDARRLSITLARNTDKSAPELSSSLSNDTGSDGSDGITTDSAIIGTITDINKVTSLKVAISDTDEYTEIIGLVGNDGSFSLTAEDLNTINGSPLADGEHTLHFFAKDQWANKVETEFTLTLDTTAPEINADLTDDTGSDSGDGITNNPSITGNVMDDVPLASLKAGFGDATFDITDVLEADGSFTLDAAKLAEINGNTPLADGDYTLSLEATDVAGNETATTTLSFALDTTAPEVTLTEPLANSAITANSKLVGTINEEMVMLSYRFNDGDTVDVTVTDGNFEQTLDLSSLTEGNNSLTLIATDKAGNVTEETVTVNVDFDPGDITPPVISVGLTSDTGSDSDDGITKDPSITGKVTDDVAVTMLKAGFGNANFDITSLVQADGSFAINAAKLAELNGNTPLANDDYTLNLVATDEAGNETTAEISFTLDTIAPEVTLTEPLANSTITINSKLAGTINEEMVMLSYRFNDGDEVDVPVTDGSFEQTLDLSSLTEGNNSLTLIATDKAGNITEETVTVNVDFDPGDITPPVINVDLTSDTGSDSDDGITKDPSITGNVTDDVAVTMLKAGFGNANFDITSLVQADGSFTLDAAKLAEINGNTPLANGDYTLNLVATDEAGNDTTTEISFTLDTIAPTASVPSTPNSDDTTIQVVFNETVTGELTETNNYTLTIVGGDNDGQTITVDSVTSVNSTTVRLNLASALVAGDYSLEIAGDIKDTAGNSLETQSLDLTVEAEPAKPVEITPFDGEEMVTLTRETIVRFDKKVDPATVTSDNFYAIANGNKVAGRIVVSSTEEFATLFYDDPLPQSTEVRVVVGGDTIIGRDGIALDADGDGTPGGEETADFRTLSVARIEGTDVYGYVYDSYNRNPDGSNIPLEGVKITLDSLPNVSAVTDENGYFILENVPAPEFYVYIDGSGVEGAAAGTQYASLGKAFHSVPGEAVRLSMDGEDFDIYLPPMAESDVVALSTTEDTDVGFGPSSLTSLQERFPDIPAEVWARTQVTYPAGSAQNDEGQAATKAMIIPVDPERLPAPLPPNIDPKLVISIQAGGEQGFNREAAGGATNFDVPAPIQFPNLEGLEPGEKSLIWSFNHDAGDWEIIGTGTVSGDGLVIESDEGVGIEAPGWHFVEPGSPTNGPDDPDKPDCDPDVFTWENAIDLFEQVTKCAANFTKIQGAIAALFNIVSEGKSLLSSAEKLGKQIGEGELDAEAIQAALQTINSTKKILKTGFDEIKDQNPVGKALAISKCLEGLLEYASGVCDKITEEDSDCATIVVKTVCSGLDLARATLGKVNALIETAKDGLSESLFALICGTIDQAQALAGLGGINNQSAPIINNVSNSESVLTNEDIEPEINKEELVATLNLLVSQLEEFLTSTEASAEVGSILDETTAQINEFTPEANKLYGQFIGYPADAYYLIEYNDFQLRGKTDNNGKLSAVLPPNTEYTISIYDSVSSRIATHTGTTNASGSDTKIPALSFVTTGGIAQVIENIGEELTEDLIEGLSNSELYGLPDTDSDGLVDEAEKIIGTISHNPDTDNDGIDDLAEIEQGLDPLGGQGFPTGIIASLPLLGEAKAVTVEGSTDNTRQQTAYVATGSHGLAIVDASQFNNPIILGQLNLTGDATDVAVESSLGIAAVATNSGGLQLVDVSDPMLPTVIQTLSLNANKVEIADGVAYATVGTSLKAIDILTGEEIQSITLPGSGTITDLAVEGTQLYSYTSGSDIFAVIDISNPGSPALLGQTTVSIASGDVGISAGNGVAFLAGSGLRTIDISDPTQPTLIKNADSFFTARDISLNGSGLGVVAAEGQGLAVYNTANPNDTDNFLTRFDTPGFTYDAAIASGIAYVADGSGGLQVINYLSFDNQGNAPTVNISTDVDVNSNTAGIQVVEGSAVPIQVDVSDDEQVRNVELLVNGEVVANDVSFPFDLSAIALSATPDTTTVEVQVRATDTGGNTTLSNTLTLNTVPDTFAPEVSSTIPAANSRRRAINGISVRFNEGIDPELVSLSGITLTNLGADGAVGGGDDTVVTPQDIQVSESGRSLFVIPPEESQFTPGNYQLQLDPTIIKDRAGNALEEAFVLNFTKRSQNDPLNLGEKVEDTIFADDDDQIFTFTGTAGQRIYFDGIKGDYDVYAKLVSPSGVNLFSFQSTNSDRQPLTLIENGTYELIISTNSTVNEDYSFQLLNSTANELELDTEVEGTLDPGTSTQVFSFEATKGQKFYLDDLNDDFSYDAYYSIYNPANQYVTNTYYYSDTEFTASGDGTYLLAVQGLSDESVDYSFNLITTETTTETLTLGETVSSNISEAGEEDLYTFTATAGQTIYFDGMGSSSSIYAYLTSPGGQNIVSSYLSSDYNPITLTEGGTYQLKIDGSGNSIGDYSFRILDTANATELALDTVTTGTIANGTSTDLYEFTATKGQKFYLDGQGATDYNGYYTIYNPNNGSVAGQYFGFDTEFIAPADGTYLLAVQGASEESVDYSFNLITPETTATQNLTIGQTITGNIAEAGEEYLYTFTGTVGQKLYFDGISNDANASAYLTSPSGQNISSSWYLGSDYNSITLTESGTYQLKIDNSGDNTGDYSFRILDLADATELALDTVTTGTIANGTSTDLYEFTATKGQKFYLDGQGTTDYNGYYTIYNPNNGSVAGQYFGFDTEFIAPADGTYLLAVQGASEESVDYSFNLTTPETTATQNLTIGQTVTGNISEAGEEDIYTFTGTVGQKLYFDGMSSNSSINASLTSPSGDDIFSLYVSSDNNPVTLTESGIYQLKISDNYNSTGDYSFRLLDLANATEFNLDETKSGTLDSLTTATFKFDAQAGQTLSLDGMGTEYAGSYTIYNSGNSYITSQYFGFDSEFTITRDGTYYLLAQSNSSEAVDYSFQISETIFEEPTPVVTTPLTLGTTVTESIAETDEEDFYTFTGTVGQKLYFDGISAEANAYAYLTSPSGQSIPSSWYLGSDSNPFTLTESGTYQLQVNDYYGDTGDYSFRILNAANAEELTLDTLTTGTTANGKSTDLYEFTATKGQKFYLDGQGTTNYEGYYTIYSPNNQSVAGYYFGFDNEFTAPADGTYLLTAQGSSDAAVNYSFNLITPETTTDTLTLGETVTGNLSEAGEENIYTFTGNAGQKLYFDGLSGDYHIDTRLISPSGQSLYYYYSDVNSDTAPLTLTENGTYQLVIDGNGSITGDYSFRLLDLADATALSLDTVTTGTLANGRNTNLYEFTATKGQKLYLDGQGTTNYNGYYAIYSSNNQSVAGYYFGLDTEFTAPANGTYFLAAQGSSNAAVNYSFNLITPEITTETLNLNQTVTGNIGELGEENIYTFTATKGQKLFFDGLSTNASIYANLTSPSGQNILSSYAASDYSPITLKEGGTYQLKLDGSGSATGDYSFRVLDLADATALSLDTVTTGTLANGKNTNLYEFTASKGQKFYLDGQGTTGSGTYYVYSPNNGYVVGQTFGYDTEFTAPANGTYFLAAQGNSNTAVNYSFNLITPTIDNTGSLALGQTVSNSISESGEEDIYTFTANAGQTLYFDGITGDYNIYANLTSPSGQNLFSFQSVNSNRSPLTLIESGTYQLRIDGNGLTTGNYSFLLSDTNQAPELNFNSTIADTLAANTSKVFRFTGAKNQNISFEDLGSQSGGAYRLFGPGNQSITSRSFQSDFEVTLPGAGTYTLILDNSSSNPLNYNFRVV